MINLEVIYIGIGDWFIIRSEAFKILVDKFKEHKKLTKTSFSRVKTRHYIYDRKINELQARVKELETLHEVLNMPQIKKKKRQN